MSLSLDRLAFEDWDDGIPNTIHVLIEMVLPQCRARGGGNDFPLLTLYVTSEQIKAGRSGTGGRDRCSSAGRSPGRLRRG